MITVIGLIFFLVTFLIGFIFGIFLMAWVAQREKDQRKEDYY
jgi:hypothetical protein